ncbi:hypothetical protein AVEN_138943-1 [Araneus ventricosus]|uniref:Uncharacterized protein n=1 Tax=Araneus ventricosus TaxID=182803 RepID=A0A4Y2M3S0_ARAVE|nr:hypothetical protein AVEN_138943-1 [Araneus ventricosus]
MENRRILYKTVFERMLAYGSSVRCLHPSVSMARKIPTIQRSFLLNISGAYSTTATATSQVILGIAPIHLQLQQESRFINICRLNQPSSIEDFPHPDQIEVKVSGWVFQPSKHLKKSQISLEDGGNSKNFNNIYSDGSKTEFGAGLCFLYL